MYRTQIIAIISAILLLVVVLELVRRRKLKEEYSWLWLFAATCYLLTAVVPGLTKRVAGFFGTSNTALAFTFLGLLFLVLILIQYSIRLSQLSTQVKDLAQHLAILDQEKEQPSSTNEARNMSPEEQTSKEFLGDSKILIKGKDVQKTTSDKEDRTIK